MIFNVLDLESLHVPRLMHMSTNRIPCFLRLQHTLSNPTVASYPTEVCRSILIFPGYRIKLDQPKQCCFCLSLICYRVCCYCIDKEASLCCRAASRCAPAVINVNNFCSMSLRSIGAVENSDLITQRLTGRCHKWQNEHSGDRFRTVLLEALFVNAESAS